jgi:hypothetical protein
LVLSSVLGNGRVEFRRSIVAGTVPKRREHN